MKAIRKISKSLAETKKIAEKLAKEILKTENTEHAAVVALTGDLGSGKTTFTQYFAKALGVKERITSPTFVILKCFRLHVPCFKKLVHVDAYRLDGPKDLEKLNWKELIKNPENIILIEWADRIKKIIPKEHFSAVFGHKSLPRRQAGEKSRHIDIKLKK